MSDLSDSKAVYDDFLGFMPDPAREGIGGPQEPAQSVREASR